MAITDLELPQVACNRNDRRAVEGRNQPPVAHERPLWVRPREACRLAGIKTTTLYQWLKDGTVLSRRVGGARLISVASLEQLGKGEAA